jgi:von Willebrand factor type A domain
MAGTIDDGDVYADIVTFVQAVAIGFNVRDGLVRVGVVTYDTSPRVEFYLSDYASRSDWLMNAITFNRYYGSSNTQAALNLTLNTQVMTGPCGSIPMLHYVQHQRPPCLFAMQR